ncbi:tRNA ligase [Smittium culicis]|uniref:tRNA ligase n=1 Tax=Smittium culicis TaxID=133412 RepID=A0A1R1YDR9_9FUNG|nr:tRNA ligase [Smittium culicis]
MNLSDIVPVDISTSEQKEINKLAQNLIKQAENRKIAQITSNEYNSFTIDSYRFTEHLYYKDPCPFATQARGLFITKIAENNYKIAARGYNKFFNINETKNTKWDSISQNTSGPYEVTLKENGCIIFISALDPQNLLICSKHSLKSEHATKGKEWLQLHLASKNKTEADFASFLYQHSVTAIFELCDDSFEEHILEYPKEITGLHLHGINRNTATLHTWPTDHVNLVSLEFGFIPINSQIFDTAKEVEEFADKIRKDKIFKGRHIEGFVVRAKPNVVLNKKFKHESTSNEVSNANVSNYCENNNVFMFKIKYDEPYLMYREFREVSKRIISNQPIKFKYPLSRKYAQWFKSSYSKNPKKYDGFLKSHGIIKARNDFLKYYDSLNDSEKTVNDLNSNKILIITVATIACGKTTVATCLSKIFGIPHIQNDNITAKKNARQAFHDSIGSSLLDSDVVIADRNNHIPVLRKSLCDFISENYPGTKIVALYWDRNGISKDKLQEFAYNRVESRGENHQSLTPQRTPNYKFVINKFIKEFVPLNLRSRDDSLIDDVIKLDPLASSKVNLSTCIRELTKLYPAKFPLPKNLFSLVDETLEFAINYKPTVIKNVSGSAGKPAKKPLYFGLKIKDDLLSIIHNNLLHDNANNSKKKSFGYENSSKLISFIQKLQEQEPSYTSLKEPHITLVHAKSEQAPNRPPPKILYDSHLHIFEQLEKSNSGPILVDCVSDYLVSDSDILGLRVTSMTARSPLPNGIDISLILEHSHQQPNSTQNTDLKNTSLTNSSKPSHKVKNHNLACTNLVPHITLAYHNTRKPRDTNNLMLEVFGDLNSKHPNLSKFGASARGGKKIVVPMKIGFKAILSSFRF